MQGLRCDLAQDLRFDLEWPLKTGDLDLATKRLIFDLHYPLKT